MRKCDRKTLSRYEEKFGSKIVDRAEVLAAMDCLMHHLKDEEDLFQWVANAIKDEHNWDVLDWDPAVGAERCESYVNLARDLDDDTFECICRTFASIVSGQCFVSRYCEGAFDGSDFTREPDEP